MTRPCSSSPIFRRSRRSPRAWIWLTCVRCFAISILMPPGEGTRRAALRWLDLLRVADIPRARSVFTHHPDYADLTPVQYADGLEWLRRTGIVDRGGRPVVNFSTHELSDRATASRIARLKWSETADAVRQATGAAGEAALVGLLAQGGATRIVHVAAFSDTYGYDIAAVSPQGAAVHLEVKATTDPTRLVIHLTRHEYKVLCKDPDWLLAAVLTDGRGQAVNVVTVDTDWLRCAAPMDRDQHGTWESTRYAVPAHALTAGLVRGDGSPVVPAVTLPFLPLWGLATRPAALSV
ncbi:protein NO VEIN domain-containing protein [Streptomyces sp. NPDC058067]|uniref:protein NO VEIN domain-containing protein n=1 Tax=Streptomyces sp. NPDC058067 TaxID=3346324 RepID=UPI0036E39A3E